MEKTYYCIQLGKFKHEESAKACEKVFNGRGYDTRIVQTGDLFKVQTGEFREVKNACNMLKRLREKGYNDIFISLYRKVEGEE